jgi:hypothetical protein
LQKQAKTLVKRAVSLLAATAQSVATSRPLPRKCGLLLAFLRHEQTSTENEFQIENAANALQPGQHAVLVTS